MIVAEIKATIGVEIVALIKAAIRVEIEAAIEAEIVASIEAAIGTEIGAEIEAHLLLEQRLTGFQARLHICDHLNNKLPCELTISRDIAK